MSDRFTRFPAALASRTRTARFGDIPALLAHPDWERPAPVMIWLHGRTVNKELDPGRYLRWIRAGIAACAIDLPGHGERADSRLPHPANSLELIGRAVAEIDTVVAALRAHDSSHVFDLSRVGIGGMSAGGMATLRRLCDPHPFTCAAVEGATGNLLALYHPPAGEASRPWPVSHPPERITPIDPMQNLAGWKPTPLLILHSEADRIVPIAGLRTFVEAVRAQTAKAGGDPSIVEFTTWPETGAPDEHAGFGRVANDAKNAQVEFLKRHLNPVEPAF